MTLGKQLGLTGSHRIILDEIEQRRRSDQEISVRLLAEATSYHRSTVIRTLADLRALGCLEIQQPCPGAHESRYIVTGRTDA